MYFEWNIIMKRIALAATLSLVLCVGMGFGLALAQQLPFSPARSAGDLIFLSGEIPIKPGGTFEQGSTTAQTRQIMDNLKRTLKANG